MELAIQDDGLFVQGRKGWGGDRPFDYSRALGVTRIRVNLLWSYTMLPNQYKARNKPATINYQFAQIDDLIDRAAQNGIRVHLSLTGPAPRWANARRATHGQGLVQAQCARIRRVEQGGGRALRRSRRPLQHLERAQLEDLARPAEGRALDLPQHVLACLQGDQVGRFAGQGPDRRDEPVSAPGLSTAPLAFLRSVTCVDRNYKRTRLVPEAQGRRLRPSSVRLRACARL